MAFTPNNPLQHNLTRKEMIERGEIPLYIGGTLTIRFQYLTNAGVPVDLSGAEVEMWIYDGKHLVKRTTDAATGNVDADQSAIVTVDGVEYGTGWYEFRYLPADIDLKPLEGMGRRYLTLVRFSPTVVTKPHFAGLIDINNLM